MKTVYHLETGASLEVEPIDARELVAGGEYSYKPPDSERTPVSDMDRGMLKDELNKLGIEFEANAKTTTLAKLLEQARAKGEQTEG